MLLHVEGLQVEFGPPDAAVTVLDQVSLSIARGQILGLVGESGAGKSVLGSALLGLLEPPARLRAARACFDGQACVSTSDGLCMPLGRGVSAIFQDPLAAMDPLMRVGDQLVETILAHHRLSRAQARTRARDLLQDCGIEPAQLRAYPHELSGGQRQRVVIALALAPEPKLIIADEPSSSLDVTTQAGVLALLCAIVRERAMALLLITHDLGVVAQTSDQIAVIYAGRIVEAGPTRAILDHPKHPYTRALLAAVPSLSAPFAPLHAISGIMPGPGAAPGGCAFHPRCPDRLPRCASDRPQLPAGEHARVACWLHAQIADQA